MRCLAEQLQEWLDRAIDLELVDHPQPASLAHLCRARCVVGELQRLLGKIRPIAGTKEEPGDPMFHQFGNSGDVRCDYRFSKCHRFH